jgi:hypothetical protein
MIDTEEPQEIVEEIEYEEIEYNENVEEPKEEGPKEEKSPSIIRTAEHGCWEIYDGVWGSYLRQAFDPDANAVITDEHLKHFELKEGIHKIPAELWAKWIRLCFHFVNKVSSSVEVSVRILRSSEDPSVYRILVPKQKVSGASVRVDNFDEAIDIETGEEIVSYPPDGWVPVGSSHSHNTMASFFSGTDDKYELGDPGIHLVVGSINTTSMNYTIAASVVGSGRRFLVPYTELVDATPITGAKFHEKVLDYVDYTTPVTTYSTKGGYNTSTWSNHSTKWTKKETPSNNSAIQKWNSTEYWGYDRDDFGDYVDPFFWSESYTSSGGSSGVEKSTIDIWNIKDLLTDFVKDNNHDISAIKEMRDELYDFLMDVEILIATK